MIALGRGLIFDKDESISITWGGSLGNAIACRARAQTANQAKGSILKTISWRWVLLAVVVLGALLLRVHGLSQIFFWLDETDFFNEHVYGNPPDSLLTFLRLTKKTTTNTWGWPAVIWMSCQLFGRTLGVARAPSVLVGTAAVLLVFILVYRLIPMVSAAKRFVPAIFAATLTAIAMPQMEFSQRTYAYGATPFMAAALLLAHLKVLRALSQAQAYGSTLFRAVALYTAVGSLALCIHPSLSLLLAVSAAFLVARASRNFFEQTPAERYRIFRLALGAGLILLCSALLNVKNPKYGFRLYLVRYYHQPTLRSLPRLFKHAYDLGTYHLNLFYNTSLYWPERVNWAILPLILLCVLGWALAGAGKFGPQARHLAVLGSTAMVMPAVLSLREIFPFGGVRQTLFLSPFLFAFTALGFYALRGYRVTRVLGSLVAILYLAVWAFNLPRFYDERVAAYSAQDIVKVWEENGQLPYYTRGCEREVQYVVRHYPAVQILSVSKLSKAPYLLISTHWPPIENNTMFFGYAEYLREAGYKATLVLEKPPKHLESLEYSTSLYFPPNGLWIYKITAE